MESEQSSLNGIKKLVSSAKIRVQVKSQGENSKTPSWTKSRLTQFDPLNEKDETKLKR